MSRHNPPPTADVFPLLISWMWVLTHLTPKVFACRFFVGLEVYLHKVSDQTLFRVMVNKVNREVNGLAGVVVIRSLSN